MDTGDVLISFRIKKSHEDDEIRKLFSECKTNKERADLTKSALNFYVQNKDKINDLNDMKQDIKEILSEIDELKSSGIEIKIKNNNDKSNLDNKDKESEDARDKWSSAVEDMFKF
ncbi:hypothetical protein ACFHWD_20200 [Clostridium sp. MT-14]|jgi:hypothetical protein|uniref:Uncharacterized protein n=1 Tax=Clostridium aromativorans TaxID=2836848 RepID=A0ABS8NAG9_9CLOT|nr:hypothetical protein [Clostridium aromativorans]MCC9296835.1 hypothetical protein [Clostridium aromativorans]CAB1249479.1 Exonuclease SbcC [Clostridiaceae bacterium BL-3]